MKKNSEKYNCFSCGYPVLERPDSFDICPICRWQDDGVQNDDPDYGGGANKASLNEHKEMWKTKTYTPEEFSTVLRYLKAGNIVLPDEEMAKLRARIVAE